jgi:co-chaperonin GroES (HSP10)
MQIMTPSRNKFYLSCASLTFLLVLAVGSVDSDSSSSDRPSASIPEGNRVIVDAAKGTTLQKERHKEANKGKTFEFGGEVTDVTSSNELDVQIDSGNHATVTFKNSVEHLEKGVDIKFKAAIEEFGSGILTNHMLGNAELNK